ncbi:MAG: type II toxin-antitoxin system HicA family toxin [Alphaproteobacteria bacterium]
MTWTRRPASTLERMRANPRADWTIADVERLCREVGLKVTPPHRGSHYKVRRPENGTILTIPARRPIKPVYIRALVALADTLRNKDEG